MAKVQRQKRLVLSDEQKGLIKGLTVHTDYSDQMILGIFSHRSRSINGREVSAIRSGEGEKYSAIQPASQSEVEDLLRRAAIVEKQAKSQGLIPTETYFELVVKSTEAMKSAIHVYNSLLISWKTEIFIVNAIIAWTYALHAYYKKNGVDYRYKQHGAVQLTPDGQEKYWELGQCIKTSKSPLTKGAYNNLTYLLLVRHEIEHRMCENIDSDISGKLHACCLNFDRFVRTNFGEEHSFSKDLSFALQMSELSLQQKNAMKGTQGLPKVIEFANQHVEASMSSLDYNDPEYSYRVLVVSKTVNNKNKADQAVTYAEPGSDIEMAVREVERPKYTATAIVEKLQNEGFSNFSVHKKDGFVEFWKSIDAKKEDKRLGTEIAGVWYWYEAMVDRTREYLISSASSN